MNSSTAIVMGVKPLVACQRVGMVASYSNNDNVNPANLCHSVISAGGGEHSTVYFLVVLHDQERVVVEVAEVLDIRPGNGMRIWRKESPGNLYSTLQ